MKFFSARRSIPASVIAVVSMAALIAPGAASALPGKCKGTSTDGAGSSLQAEAIGIWKPGFETNKVGCPGGPKITEYKSIGSGAGYKTWHEKEEYGINGFIATDNTVNQSEKEAVEGQVDEGKTSKLLTIPVLQGAVAVVVNLPEKCTATSSIATGRLAFNDSTLEEIFQGRLTKWSELEAVEGAGNKLEGAECDKEAAITPVVRKDGSGTTHIFKRFLGEIFTGTMAAEGGINATWGELARRLGQHEMADCRQSAARCRRNRSRPAQNRGSHSGQHRLRQPG